MTLVSKWFLEYILINYTMFKIAVPYMNHMYHVELTDIEVNELKMHALYSCKRCLLFFIIIFALI